MTRQLRLFLCALQFLTRLPTPALPGFEAEWIARSTPYYPVVGWVVGAISAAVLLGAERLWGPGVGAALAIGAGVLATGGFHEDGLADTADGLGGGQSAARRLEIMKDSRVGSFGVLALLVVLGVKAAALASMPPLRAALALVAAHGMARALPVVVMTALPYVGDPATAKLKPAAVGVRGREAAAALALGLATLPLIDPWRAVLGLSLAVAAAGAVALSARRLIGGWTGDVLGAVEQAAELALLLGAAAA